MSRKFKVGQIVIVKGIRGYTTDTHYSPHYAHCSGALATIIEVYDPNSSIRWHYEIEFIKKGVVAYRLSALEHDLEPVLISDNKKDLEIASQLINL
jgi:hypothetical protein